MKLKSALLYILVFIVAAAGFLFFLFPQKQAAVCLSSSLTMLNPNIHFSMEKVKPIFPIGLKLENLTLLLNHDMQIMPDYFKVFWNPASIFKKDKQLKFKSALNNGSVKGSISLKKLDPFLFSNAIILISGIKINEFNYQTGLADIILSCELNGEYKQIEAKEKKEFAHGMIFIQNLSAKMEKSLFNTLKLPVVDFSDIELEFTQNPKNITMVQVTARGSIINVSLNGYIETIFPLPESRLHLSGSLLPDSPYLAKFANLAKVKSVNKNISKHGIRFNINGTLKNPKIAI